MDIIEIDASTGEVTQRDFTPAESAQRKTDLADSKRVEAETEATEADRQATITAARDHAASLGFTEAMLAVMYPNLAP